jgi:hypothetical protein
MGIAWAAGLSECVNERVLLLQEENRDMSIYTQILALKMPVVLRQ